jgi:aldehyde dehydrogenase (NAD+)
MATPPKIDVSTLPTQLFINGKFVDAISGRTYETTNPVTEEAIIRVAEAGEEDVDAAVRAAHHAFHKGEWGKTTAYKRSRLMMKLADLMERDQALLAALETLDNGKPFTHSYHVDLALSIHCFRYFAGFADKIEGKTFEFGGPVSQQKGDIVAYTRHEPVGVVGQIIPWNFPLLMAAWKLGPALAVGCAVVLKLAEQTPLTGLYLAKLAQEAGYPAGALNVLSGWGDKTTDGKVGPGVALVAHKLVDKIAFTGSTAVGRHIMKAAADTFKRVTLELGGKSPNIIFPDADLDAAVQGAHNGLFFNQGQCCCAGSRVLVHEDIYDEFVKRSVELAKARKVGDPYAPDTAQGPQVSKEQFDIVMGYIESGKKDGAKCVAGGERAGDKGYFVQPTVFADVGADMKIWQEEIFGPVMCIKKFKSIDEVVDMANDTIYGLAAAVWTKDIGTAQEIIQRVRAGTIWVNCYNVFDNGAPFGGFKASGLGREGGEYSLRNYTEVKQVTMQYKPKF